MGIQRSDRLAASTSAASTSTTEGTDATLLKCPYRQIFLLAILNLGMISIVYVQKFFDLVNSSIFYGRLKLAKEHFSINLVRCYQKSGTSIFRDVIQGTREHRL